MTTIKTWQERVEHGSSIYAKASALDCEIAELRTALAERDAEIGRVKGNLSAVMARACLSGNEVHADYHYLQEKHTTLRTAAQQALDALQRLEKDKGWKLWASDGSPDDGWRSEDHQALEAITTLTAALKGTP